MNRPPNSNRRERGFSLIVSLILLVVITLVALAGMRSVAMESRMSATTYDRSLALQSAETAVREAEAMAAAGAASASLFPAAGCSSGYCAQPAPADKGRWVDAAFNSWQPATADVSDKAEDPELIVERNGEGENWVGCGQEIPRQPNCRTPRFRVTGRSTGAGRAAVILQSDVATQ